MDNFHIDVMGVRPSFFPTHFHQNPIMGVPMGYYGLRGGGLGLRNSVTPQRESQIWWKLTRLSNFELLTLTLRWWTSVAFGKKFFIDSRFQENKVGFYFSSASNDCKKKVIDIFHSKKKKD